VINSRRMRPAGHVAYKGEKRNAYRVLMGEPGGKRSLERPRYNFETGLKEIGWKDVDWIDLANDREE
jgi:hypothetical protein